MGEMSMRNFVNNWIIVFILCVIQHNYYMEKETKINEDSMQLKMVERWVESITRKIGRDHFAYLLLFLAAMMYPLCFVYVSKRDYHPVEANLVRGISIFVTHYFVLRWMGLDLDFKGSKNNKWLLVRSAAMLINQICYTVMHYVVPLPVINILNISGSLCVFILDYLLYGIPIHRGQVPGIIAGCLGVAFAASGEFLTALWDPTYTPNSDFGHYIVTDLGMRCIFGCLYILASLVWAYGLVIQK
jgi:drug/metabolite transporter (DMT)-like permease